MPSGPVALTVSAAPTPNPTREPPAPNVGTGPNLIVNGDAEQGTGTQVGVDTNTVPGWQVTGLLNSVAYGAQGGEGITDYPTAITPDPQHRGHNVFSGDGGGVSTGTQTADVSHAAHRIDRGQVRRGRCALGGPQDGFCPDRPHDRATDGDAGVGV